ncbi:maturation protein [ssRNA phage Zoerhiza.1_8]|uniref:Maturation protein n=2 Tax=Leviviricetes TaxID=2842243 RepID=A0A8S5L2T7_9VIRU|nr:maturation protein [ssRNA phage Zoerhiza.1_8]QDH90966.1 MAG: hypothetical protein H1Rhizo25607_000004 [Leviviridae sp.]DAD52118.1 TPA_asm: maturation protein [ssRNA phage Zoerhiza.1_8]
MSNGYTKQRSSWSLHNLGKVTLSNLEMDSRDYSTAQWGTVEQISGAGHPWYSTKKLRAAGGFRDVGGTMEVRRVKTSMYPVPVSIGTGTKGTPSYNAFNGQFVPDVHIRQGTFVSPPSLPNIVPSSTVMAQGTKGWNKYKPTHQAGSLGQAIGELREGLLPVKLSQIHDLRHAFKDLKSLGKAVGGGHLAAVFGVLPLVQDIKDLARNVHNMDKNIQQLARDNGRLIRRGGIIEITESESNTIIEGSGQNSFIYPNVHVGLWQPGTKSKKYTSVKTSTTYRFSGRFRYWIDPSRFGYKGIPDRYQFQLSRIAFGLDPTDLSTYYELMPWSWLIDWAVPLGPMLENFFNDSLDNLVADYAYVSAHQNTTENVKVTSVLNDGRIIGPMSEQVIETKQRYAASPYGFGILLSDLSLKRLAILASLGLTKLF